MSAVVLPSPLDIPQAPPDGFTQEEHRAIVSLLYACFTTAEGELNRRFEQECVGIVLITPRYDERAERTGKDVSVYPVSTNQPYPEEITVGQLLEAPTGQTMATYVSGMGFLPERWEEELDRRLSGWLYDQITAILGDEERAFTLDAFDAYEVTWLLTAWLGAQESRPIAPMIERWGPDVLEDARIAELDKHKRQAEQARLVAAMRERAEHAAALLAHLHGAPLPRFEMAQRTALERLCLRAVDHGLTVADVRAFATYAPQDLLSLRLRSHLAKWAEQHLPLEEDAPNGAE
jgi:hypothetical protein